MGRGGGRGLLEKIGSDMGIVLFETVLIVFESKFYSVRESHPETMSL